MKIFKSGGEIMMEYINIFGAISMLIIMIPNIIYAIKKIAKNPINTHTPRLL